MSAFDPKRTSAAADLAFFQNPPKFSGVHIASHKKLEGVAPLIKKQLIAAQYLDLRVSASSTKAVWIGV